MAAKKQAPKTPTRILTRRILKLRLIDRRETVRALAVRVGHHEAVVSKAINHGKYPLVRAKIAEALNV